jgi:putative nucleotidyltransferase with HDIG domain
MKVDFNPDLTGLLDIIRDELAEDRDMFLVGGALRDVLLGVPVHDMDFAMAEDPSSLAKSVAKKLKSGFYVLDDDRHTARVMYYDGNNKPFPLDFVQFTGNSIFEDLTNRDFTLNAMALSLRDPLTLIDPLEGNTDLMQGQLRTCSPQSLRDDPVRVLRGIRLATQFGFSYISGLEELMATAGSFLPSTSIERQRDEFFKILEGPDPYRGIVDCFRFNVINHMFPLLMDQKAIPASPPHILPLFEHTLAIVKYLDKVFACLAENQHEVKVDTWWGTVIRNEVRAYSEFLSSYLEDEITRGRSKRGLLMLSALLHDIGKPKTLETSEDGHLHYYGHEIVGAAMAWEAAKRIQLSNAESEWISKIVRYHMALLPWLHSDGPPSRRSLYRFFKQTGDAGLGIALLSLADKLATYGENISPEKWQKNVMTTKRLLSTWFDDASEIVSPQPWLDGYDLQEKFGLKPGRQIGRLLDALLEAQASGEVSNQDEAETFIRQRIGDGL